MSYSGVFEDEDFKFDKIFDLWRHCDVVVTSRMTVTAYVFFRIKWPQDDLLEGFRRPGFQIW